MEECEFTCKVRAVLYDKSLSASEVESVTLYVFDSDGKLLEERQSELDKLEEFNYPYAGPLDVYALANAHSGVNETVVAAPNGKYDGSCVSLIPLPAGNPYYAGYNSTSYKQPSMLLLGDETAPNYVQQPDVITDVPIHVMVGSVRVTIRGIKEYLDVTDDDFSVLALPRYDCLYFDRTQHGNQIAIEPSGAFVGADEYEVPAFRFLSSTAGEAIVLHIFHKDELVDTVTTDRDGNPLVTYNGKLVNVLLNYGAYVNVSVKVMPWDEVYTWKEFGE